ncbi:Uncharacterized response regulatory protein SA0215 [uncultured Clostridium sp.]|uniref:response regulator transcription factor n=1 Tax=uncultured Clostridium sp. TaxID=59620 RepID=UPI000821DD22|nr:response regulator [uncultured Clostridium sp.]SCJ99861.1 Uncharacterized response regulatory protein SA0215 [uncultured Clostridium sp.]
MYKVLIVEDENMIRKGLIYTFNWEELGLIVVGEASNGAEGIEKIEELNPDIVIVDVNMPIMTGIEMLENSIDKYMFSSIILSGYAEFSLAKKAVHLDVVEYLLKPVDTEQLKNALNKAKEKITQRKQVKIIKDELKDFSCLRPNLIKDKNKTSIYVLRMIEYVNSNYKEKISIQNLVETLGVSSTFLNNEFKKETTYTFNDYLNRFRINKAIEIIKNSDEKIYNIASDVGFKDYRYFINVFKKYTNCVPSDFR